MLQRQFISRVIQEMSEIPNRLKKLSTEGKWEQVEAQTGLFYQTYLDAGSGELTKLSITDLLLRFKQDVKAFEPISAVIAIEAENLQRQGKIAEAMIKGRQALTMLKYLNEKEVLTFSKDRKDRIEVLEQKYK
jgi:hypothetical protein